MAKYLIDKDELYPVYGIYPAVHGAGPTRHRMLVDLSQEQVGLIKQADDLWDKTQDMLEKLYVDALRRQAE